METEEIIKQAKLYFGRNRKRLKNKVTSFELDGKEYRSWRRRLRKVISQPFDLSYGMFDDVVECLKAKQYNEIDWKWLGDLSWKFKILLNKDVRSGFDWGEKLARNCGETARIAVFYVSDVIPCYVFDAYYMAHSRKEKYYEFGPLQKLTDEEREIINKVKRFFQNSGISFLSRKAALKKHRELYSDCNSGGNASLFDALFCDTDSYQTEIKRFNNYGLKDAFGRNISWNEYYDKDHKLIRREEYRFLLSKDVECVTTDSAGQIVEVKVWRDIEKDKHQEFVLDILAEYKKRKRKQAKQKLTKKSS